MSFNLLVTVWETPNENPGDFIEATYRHSGFRFDTALHGGFGQASFKVEVGGWNAVRWYRSYLGKHIVVFDYLGRRVYEGRIEETDASSDGVSVQCSGYYAHAQDLLHGIIYPAGTPASISDIIEDTVDLASVWSTDKSHIITTTMDISPQDFTGEAKLHDAVEQATKFGSDDVIPRPVYFAIWEHRIAHLFIEPQITDEPDWQVHVRHFTDASGLSLNRSRREVWNKIQVLYDDPDIGQTFTNFAEDADSQKLFGTREGSLNIGAALPGIADTIRDLALNSFAFPIQQAKLGIAGRVFNQAGAPDYPYMVRAGDMIRVNDYDPSVSQLVTGGGGADSAIVFVNATSYNDRNNSVTVQLGKRNVALDLLMARLGMGSGGVR